jgi:ABC-type multidrug transport system fused ATPase/permease subunit
MASMTKQGSNRMKIEVARKNLTYAFDEAFPLIQHIIPIEIMTTDTLERAESLLAALKLDEGFRPQELRSEQDSGLSAALIEDLILKYLAGVGSASGRAIADHVCLPMAVLENRYTALRSRQEISPVSSGMLGDYVYRLTDQGREKAQRLIRECAYAGPAPVPLEDYANSVQAQNIRSEKPRHKQLEAAFEDIVVSKDLLQQLGPAINAGKGMFIYGPPGNGKTTIAQRITRCFGAACDCRRWPNYQAVRWRLPSASA